MATTKFKNITKEIRDLIKLVDTFETKIKSVDKSLSKKTNIAGITTAKKELNTVNTQMIKTQKQLNGIQKKAVTLNKRAEKEADKITQSLNLELQTKRELIKLNQKLTREEAKRLAAEQKFGKAQKGSINDLKRQQKELSRLRNNVSLTSKRYQELTKRLGIVNQKLRESGDAAKDNRANVGNYNGTLKKGLASLKNYAKGLIGISAAFMALRRISQAAREYIELARTQILQERKLATVLKERTNATDEQVESILALTKAQQAQGIIGDEVQIAAAQQFSTFVKQTSSVKQLIPALNNLIAQQKGVNATTQDAVTIANLAGRAFQGQLGSLTRVGISFDEAQGKILKYGTEQEKAAALAQIITQNVGEMNKELAQTDIGRIQQLDNELGDIKEEIGKELIPVIKLFKKISVQSFKDILDVTKDLTEPIRLIKEITDSIKSANNAVDKTKEKFEKAAKGIRTFISPIRAIIKWNAILLKGLRKVLQFLGIIESEQAKRLGNITKRVKELQGEFNALDNTVKRKVIKDFNELSAKFRSGEISASQFANGINQIIIKARESVEVLPNVTGEVKKLNQELGTFFGDAAAGGSLEGTSFIDSIIPDQKTVTAELDNKGQEVFQAVQSFTPTFKQKVSGYLKSIFDKDAEGTILGRIFGGGKGAEGVAAATLELYASIWNMINEQTQAELQQLDELLSRQDEAIKKTEDQLEKELDRINELKAAGQAYDTEKKRMLQAELQREKAAREKGLREQIQLKKKQKRQAIVQANIDIASSILRVFAAYEWPYNLIIAMIQAAAGTVQLQKIRNAKYAEGGWVEGPSHAQGGVDITREAEGGEFIVRKEYAAGAKHLLDGINSGYISDKAMYGYGSVDMSETNTYLSNIEKNTANNVHYLPDGRKAWEIKGNSKFIYN